MSVFTWVLVVFGSSVICAPALTPFSRALVFIGHINPSLTRFASPQMSRESHILFVLHLGILLNLEGVSTEVWLNRGVMALGRAVGISVLDRP